MSSSSINSTTSELLDLLERDASSSNTKKCSSSNSDRHSKRSNPYHRRDNTNASANTNNDDDDNNNNLRRRRGSETSLDSSFTSKLLGGYADDDDDEDDLLRLQPKPNRHHPQLEVVQPQSTLQNIDHNNKNNGRSLNANEDHVNTMAIDDIIIQHGSDNNSSFSESQHDVITTRRKKSLASSFDNPFHRSTSISSNSLNRLIESKTIDNHSSAVPNRQGSYSDVGTGHRHLGDANRNLGCQAKEETEKTKQQVRDVTIPPKQDGGQNTLQGSSNDRGAVGGRARGGGHQHSVSFSVEDDRKDHQDNNGNGNDRIDNSSTTLIPSSLGSLISYASTRSSSYSGRSSSSVGGGGSRSSKSSRGSGASTATGSTHSSGSNHSPHAQQERRRRRELAPVKKIAKATKASRGGEMAQLLMGEGGDGGNGAVVGHAARASNSNSNSSRRSRRKELANAVDSAGGVKGLAPSRNLYNNIQGLGKKTGAQHGRNLHEHHPVRYPKRSCDDDDEDESEDRSDAELVADAERGKKVAIRTKGGTTNASDAVGMGGAFGLDENEVASSHGDEEDGLFQRVNKVRNESLLSKSTKNEKSDFLDGLVKSTTGQSKLHLTNDNTSINDIVDDVNDNDGASSVGETSFLSDFLSKNSAARQRKAGQPGQRSINTGGSTTSSIINIYKKHDNGAQKSQQHQYQRQWQEGVQWLLNFVMKLSDHVMSMIRRSPIRQHLERFYNEGGDVLPRNRWEIAVMLVWVLLVLPLVRVVVIHAIRGDAVLEPGVGGQSLLISADGDDVIADVWKESSIAMLSKSSSMHENFILIPDTVWIELQISRSKAQSSGNDSIKLPKRLPLPSVIDHDHSSPSSMVLFYVTAVNSTAHLLSNNVNTNPSRRNIRLNTRLFESMQERLKPRPIDVWPCWAHNSLAHFREDGLIAMFPVAKRREARVTMKRMAKAFGQSTIYEFITTSDRAKSERRVGSDGSEIIIPGLRNGRSDVMIRRSLSTDPSDKDGAGPAVIMRRVKNLAVEDELTMREWEGPPLDQVVWNRGH